MYIERSIDEKIRIVKEYWRDGNLSKLGREYKVDIHTIGKWEKVAEEGMREALERLKPGKRNVTIQQQNEKLKGQIKKLVNLLHKKGKEEIFDEVIFCPKCKSDRIRQNGKVITRKKGIQQRYICNNCSFSIYVSLKKTL